MFRYILNIFCRGNIYKRKLKRARNLFYNPIHSLFKKKISREVIDRIYNILISADIGPELTTRVVNKLESDARAVNLREKLSKILLGILNGSESPLNLEHKPSIIVIIGINGGGKTTTTAKLGHFLKKSGKKVLFGGADTFRAAGSEQLNIWAQRGRIDMVTQRRGADPAAVAFDAIDKAMAKNYDVVIIDTAGRLHTKKNLIEELKKVMRSIEKKAGYKPDEILLVVDGTFGQNAIAQTNIFYNELKATGIVITKLDGTSRGGALFTIFDKFRIPIKFVGLGEGIGDLVVFNKTKFVESIMR